MDTIAFAAGITSGLVAYSLTAAVAFVRRAVDVLV
jgi:hypothetical protein